MRTRILLLVVLLAAGLGACKKSGDAPTVLATVNGTPITSDTVSAYVRAQTGGRDIPLTDVQQMAVVKTLINMELVTQAAEKAGIDKKSSVQGDLEVNRMSMLAELYMRDYMDSHQPTPDQLKAAYDAKLKNFDGHQYKARHILVEDEAQAKDIINQLHHCANFATLAQKYSKDPGSKDKGGEVMDGWFAGQAMVPEFTAALASLKKNQLTAQPVHSQFGWHVIQLEDSRIVPPPSIDDIKDQLESDMQQQTIKSLIDGLHAGAKIDEKKAPAPVLAPALGTAAAH